MKNILVKYFLCVITLASGFLLTFSQDTYAASSFDTVIRPQVDLKIKSSNNLWEYDITNTFGGYVFGTSDASYEVTCTEELRDIARNFTYNYTVQDYPSKSGQGMEVRLFYTDAEEVDPMIFWQSGASKRLSIDPGIAGYMVWITVTNVNQIQVSCSNSSNFRFAAEINTGNEDNYTNPYLINYPIQYPEGYEGMFPPSEIVTPTTVYMDYNFTVTPDGHFSAVYLKNLDYGYLGFDVPWEVLKCDTNWDAPCGGIDSGTESPADTFNLKGVELDGAGYYRFNALLPPYPPDLAENVEIQMTSINFLWDGRSLLVGSSAGGNYNAGDNWLLSSVRGMAIANSGLQQVVGQVLALVVDIPSYASVCSPINLPWVNGTNINLPCLKPFYQANLGIVYDLWQVLVLGLTTWFFVIKVMGISTDVFRPRKDSVDVGIL